MDRGQAPDSRPRLQVDWTGPARQEAQPWHDLESRSVTESRQPVAPFKLSSQGQGCWTSESDCYSHRPGHRRLGDLDSSRAGLVMSLAPRPLSDIDNSSLLNFIFQYIILHIYDNIIIHRRWIMTVDPHSSGQGPSIGDPPPAQTACWLSCRCKSRCSAAIGRRPVPAAAAAKVPRGETCVTADCLDTCLLLREPPFPGAACVPQLN